MTGNEYQKAALRTANMDYSSHGMIINGALGLCGEAGEVADIIKKSTFKVTNSILNTLPRNWEMLLGIWLLPQPLSV